MPGAGDGLRVPVDQERVKDVFRRCLRAMEARGIPPTAAEIARRTGLDDGQVRKILKCERPVRPGFLRSLGELAGLPVSELFAELDWLPESEVLAPMSATLAGETHAALEALERARPHLDRLTGPALPAPLAAAGALLAVAEGAERFEVRLRQVVSGGRYRTATNGVGEFLLRPGHDALPYAEAAELAAVAGVRDLPSPVEAEADQEYWSVHLELAARTHQALNTGQEYSWQGGPGHRTWRSAAQSWPAHLLVQDLIGGSQQPEAGDPCDRPGLGPIVVLGGRHGTGLAAALLAEALGWQFVLVRENMDVTRHGHVVGVPADARRDRTRAWVSVAGHIERTVSLGRPWKAVVMVRAAAFADTGGPYAMRLLRDTPAQVVYARVPSAYLAWWAEREAGNFPPGERDGAAWADRTGSLYARLETVLRDRNSPRDLLLRVPEPRADLTPCVPEIPGEVMDWTARVAWTAIRRFGEPPGTRLGPVPLRPGRLSGWRELLAADPLAIVPTLT
ncbi:MAG: family transcriptional regulator [Actinomycetia bacterium]|nr:family transcriptional regulator [Actinomycetes bacterium]